MALRRQGRTMHQRSKAFAASARAVCGSEQLFATFSSYPWKLLALATNRNAEFAQEILSDPDCVKDEWTLAFLEDYGTLEALLRPEPLALLFSFAMIMKAHPLRLMHDPQPPGPDLGN